MSELGRAPRIKNRAPAAIQITAEQLLREAQERQDSPFQGAKHRIQSLEELEEYRGRKRGEFESRIRASRFNISAWIKYAVWEASQGELPRSRSVFERALDVDPYSVPLWTRYVDTELKNRNINHARNLLDRAVNLLPRMNQMWYKYVHLEELLGNVAGTRTIFERWMEWQPDEKAWAAYIAFEVRHDEKERGSEIWERAIVVHSAPREWIKWAQYEETEREDLDRARNVFMTALEYFGESETQLEKAQTVYTAFAKLEIRAREYDRARAIYKYILERLSRSKSQGVYASYTRFEKQFGNRQDVEDTVLGKRRIQYEEQLAQPGEGADYDTWFDYIKLEEESLRTHLDGQWDPQASETTETRNRIRDLYERAIAQVPPTHDKRHWRRYIFLWLNYALFEEMDARDSVRARDVYKKAIALIPHREFTFAKLWLQFAHFEVRQLDLPAARKILGSAIGLCPKDRLFRGYIDLELSLKEFDRARIIYGKSLEWDPSNPQTWVRFAELEQNLWEDERARQIFELAIGQPSLDMPEVVWKAFIDFEFDLGEYERVYALYDALLERTGHVKVWIAYAHSQIGAALAQDEAENEGEEDQEQADEPMAEEEKKNLQEQRRHDAVERARVLFERGYNDLKSREAKEDRVVLLNAWKAFEDEYGTVEQVSAVEAKMPRVVKKRRELPSGDLEEYYDMLFPDDEDETSKPSFNLLKLAHAWKAQQEAAGAPKDPQSSPSSGSAKHAEGHEDAPDHEPESALPPHPQSESEDES